MNIKRIAIDGGNFNFDYTPYIDNGVSFDKYKAYIDNGTSWDEISNWQAATQQPSPKITTQPTGSTGIGGGYVSGNYKLYCSTTNNANSYGAWRAFNGSYSDAYGWASASSDTTPWIGILLPYSLKSIVVTIRNRTRSSSVAGPIAGIIYGSDIATLDGTVIGTFSGMPGATSAAGWSVICNNYDASYRFIRILCTDWDTSDGNTYAAIGEIYIDGLRTA